MMTLQTKNDYVLIVEDDHFYAKIYESRLAKAGFNTSLVRNGETALKLINAHKPKLILLDLIMPIIDGFEVITTLKKSSHLKDIPVIVLSNLNQQEDIDNVLSLGVKEHISKADVPITSILAKVATYLSPSI